MTDSLRPLYEIITGRPRPRHLRFATALADLAPGTVLERRDHSFLQRLRTNALCRLSGVREVKIPDGKAPVLLHQAVTSARRPYAAEFDVPLGVHGYSYRSYLHHAGRARRFLENPALKVLFVFSEWARRSFAMHFGEEVGTKCRVCYPLAAPQARFGGEIRRYDFSFISTSFRIKGGPELIRAFRAVRASGAPEARMCVVTNLDEARQMVGDLSSFQGIEWRQANLGQAAIAELLSDTHCLVHPTLVDSFGVVVVEALAAGCAVITTSIASFPELVTESNGVLLPVQISAVVGDFFIPNVDFAMLFDRLNLAALERDLTEAMDALASDHARRTKKQQASRRLYAQCFSPEAWRERLRGDLIAAFPWLAGAGAV